MKEAFYSVVDDTMLSEIEEFYAENRPKVESVRGVCAAFSASIAYRCGLMLTGGRFEVGIDENGDAVTETHWWCVDGLSRIVDVTASQFSENIGIEIPEGVTVVNPDDALYRRYIQGTIKRSAGVLGTYKYSIEMD